MHMLLRTLLVMVRSKRRPPLHVHDVGVLPLRVMPADLDLLNHVNNGVYFSLMDLGRWDLLVRSGVAASFKRHGYYPVVASETISFRKSLQPWQRFAIESRIVGYDHKACFVEQRFVVGGEIFAQGFIRARFLKRSGGVVSMAELSEVVGVDVAGFHPPEWLTSWGNQVALPPTRAAAPSEWN